MNRPAAPAQAERRALVLKMRPGETGRDGRILPVREKNVILRGPDYSRDFRCLAAACPRTCCAGWEVTVDDDTAARYLALPGPFGGRLRAELTREDGERCFRRTAERRCPFLDGTGLCEIHCRLGEDATPATCRAHPRFTDDWGPLRETSLAASCPAAARLLLGSRNALTFPAEETAERAGAWTEPQVPYLLAFREQMLDLLRDRTRPLRERMAWYLLLANQAQALLDAGAAEELPDRIALPPSLPEPVRAQREGIFPFALRFLAEQEVLEPDWPALLRTAESDAPPLPEWMGERVLCYFTFRYFLRAAADGDLLSRAELAVFSLLTAERLAGCSASPEEALSRYCRETEHCRENLRRLQEAFCRREELSLARFFGTLGL